MALSNYHWQIILRLGLIAATIYGVAYLVQLQQQYWFTLANLAAFLVLQIYWFFRYLTRWQQDLKLFTNAVLHRDFSVTYPMQNRKDPYFDLYHLLNHISQYVRTVKSESVQQDHYFRHVVESAQVGLLAYREDGTVLLSNAQVLTLLKVEKLKHMAELNRVDATLHGNIQMLRVNQPSLIKTSAGDKLSARLSKIVINESSVYVVSLVNIRTELEQNELQSWQDLISVLTHEIMNSITPIHSLNGSMVKYLGKIEGNEEIVTRARSSLEVINRRSQSLMDFVDRYRKISTVPLPNLAPVPVLGLVHEVVALMREELHSVDVTVQGNDVVLNIDRSLVEQVLINLVKNAIHALSTEEQKKLTIVIESHDQDVWIQVRDNGKGIAPEVLDKIFIPFFTTRKEGSGIGLTVSRQIINRHGGTIDIQSQPGHGTSVMLKFPR